jgi:hypothetical protein
MVLEREGNVEKRIGREEGQHTQKENEIERNTIFFFSSRKKGEK